VRSVGIMAGNSALQAKGRLPIPALWVMPTLSGNPEPYDPLKDKGEAKYAKLDWKRGKVAAG
jgi:hypothetical protein